MDDKLLAILEGDDGDLDAFNIDSDEIDFDAIPKKSDLQKGKRSGLKRPTSFDISESESFKEDESSEDAFFVESEKESPKKETKKSKSKTDLFDESQTESPNTTSKEETKSDFVETPKLAKDKSLNNVEPTPTKHTNRKANESKSFDKMTPIEIFEHTVVNYLERTTNDASRAFMDELNFLMDQAFSCDKVITHFIEEVNNETKRIVEDAYNSPPPLAEFGNEMENLINDHFTNIKKYIPQTDPNKLPTKETLSNLNFSINQALNNFMARSNVTLEEESEISSLNLSFETTPDVDFRLGQLKQMRADAETISMEQEAEFNVLAAASKRIKEEQAAFNEREMKRLTSNVTDQNSELQNEIEALNEEIEKMNNVPTLPLLENLKTTLQNAVDASRELTEANMGLVRPFAQPPPPGIGGWPGYIPVPPPMHYSPMRHPMTSRIARGGKSPDLIDDIRERIDNIRRESESSHIELSFL